MDGHRCCAPCSQVLGYDERVLAGGYDSRVVENVEHHQELVELAQNLNVSDRVIFLQSFSDSEKVWLLRESSCLVYTPAGEHFGIVPLESMYCRTPVIAVNSGGPTETVLHGTTGKQDLLTSWLIRDSITMT